MAEEAHDAKEKAFLEYSWEDDDGWCVVEQRLEYPVKMSDEQKEQFLLKRKRKYYKQKVDPDYKIPPRKPTAAKPSQGTTGSTGGSTGSTSSNSGASAGSSAQQSTSSRASYSRPSSSASSGSSSSSKGTMLNCFYVVAQWLVFVFGVLSVVNPIFFWRCLYVVIGAHVVAVVQNSGMPKFSAEYGEKLMRDDNTMIALYALVFVFARTPSLLFLSPLLLRSLLMGSFMLNGLLRGKSPALYARVQPLLQKVLARQPWFLRTIPQLEVWIGIYLVIGIFWMSGAVMLSLFYWQIMHVRYMSNQGTRSAFYQLNYTLDSAFARVPFVQRYYRKLANFLYSMVDPVQLQQRAQARPSCAVM